jgi:hypothetical protein
MKMFTFFDEWISFCNKGALVKAVNTTKINNPKKKNNRPISATNKPLVSYCSRHNHIEEINIMT